MRYCKEINQGYVSSVGTDTSGIEITEDEYNEILSVLQDRPVPPSGYDYFLRADTLEWELVELPPEPEDEPSVAATAEDYEAALQRLGVTV